MKYDKRIVTHQWGNNPTNDEFTNSNGIVMAPNHYLHSIAFLNELAEEAKRDFPDLTDDKIEAFVVAKSAYNQGFWGITFSLPANTSKEGYRAVGNLDFCRI